MFAFESKCKIHGFDRPSYCRREGIFIQVLGGPSWPSIPKGRTICWRVQDRFDIYTTISVYASASGQLKEKRLRRSRGLKCVTLIWLSRFSHHPQLGESAIPFIMAGPFALRFTATIMTTDRHLMLPFHLIPLTMPNSQSSNSTNDTTSTQGSGTYGTMRGNQVDVESQAESANDSAVSGTTLVSS